MKTNILRKVLQVTAVAMIATLAIPVAAFADNTGGGIGGGGSTGNLTGAISWKSFAYNQSGQAYEALVRESGLSRANVDKQITQRVGTLETCKQSNVIWYINHNAQNKWVYNYSYTPTHGASWDKNSKTYGTIENPAIKSGDRAPSDAEINAFKDWDINKNGNKIDQKPGYTIICSGAFSMPDKEWQTSTSTSRDDQQAVTYTYPYTWSTEVKRQISQNGIDPIGENNLHDQKGGDTKSNFGKLWDSLNTNDNAGLSPEQLKASVDEAIQKDKTIDHSKVTLDDANKAGMAEGGVLNVYEQTKFATVSSTQTTTTVTTTVCKYVQKWDSGIGQYGAVQESCSSSDAVSKRSTADKSSGTLKNTGFWQMLAVHCNQEGFNALIASNPEATVVDSGDPSKAITAVVNTKKYDSQPAKLDFGDASNPDANKAASGNLSFYDKECPFDCTADATSTSATNVNGANSNKGAASKDAAVVENGKYGANSEGHSNNSFEYFRDNSKHNISVDVWYPKNVNGVSYNGAAPLTTTVSRWAEGTPGTTDSNGGKFTMKTTDGKELFTGTDDTKNQKNWDTSKFSNSTSTIMDGLERDFTVQSTWASENNKPQVLNVKYEYAPTVSTKIKGVNIGFGTSGSQAVGGDVSVNAQIQGKCYVNYGTDAQVNTVKQFHDNTGTGTVNALDGTLIEGPKDGGNANDLQSNLKVNFVRSTTE